MIEIYTTKQLKLITKTGKTINTRARTPKGIINMWTSGAIDLDPADFNGAEIWHQDKKIGTIKDIGWQETSD